MIILHIYHTDFKPKADLWLIKFRRNHVNVFQCIFTVSSFIARFPNPHNWGPFRTVSRIPI